MFFFGGKGGGKGMPMGMGGMGMGMGFDEDDDEESADKEVDNSKLYEVLDVEKDASPAEIKKAHRIKAMKHHPDKGGDPETFKDIQRAFEVLSDPEQRQKYDAYGEEGLSGDGPSSPHDFLSQIFGGKGGGKGRAGQRPRTENLTRPMWVSLEQVYMGVTRPLPITRKVVDEGAASSTCQACDGQGMVVQVIRMGPMIQQVQQPCPKCNGTGSTAKTRTEREVLEVFVEKGSPDGHKIVFHGKADESPGHEPGDVVVVVKQQDHPLFMRKGADLYLERDISLAEALTGFRLVVKHLDGRRLVVRSKPGEVLQPQHGIALKAVAGAGMPIHQDPFKFGNLFLVLSIRFPPSLEPSAAAELRRLLGGGAGGDEDEGEPADGEDVEDAVIEDIDPLESSKQSPTKASGQAYDEDEGHGPGMQPVQCQQQ